ncbi:MAG: endonuclease/exonuclease/phosphatase family protein [Chloroflexi bacterium]|nr:endonuclease/exonuclease/phosphatase family protein [Chloroflexota bacterium]
MSATLTVATLNLFNKEGRWPQRAALVVRQFLEIGPDVAGFQEVDHRIDQGNLLTTWINGELGRQEYTAYHMFNPRGVASFESLAIVTRLPVADHDGLDYLMQDDVAHRVRLQLDGGLPLDFYNTHLYWVPSREGSEVRQKEARRLLQWAASHEGAQQVIVGDFNATPRGETVALMKGTLRSAHETAHGKEPDYTWPSPLAFTVDPMRSYGVPNIPQGYSGTLDYIFVSKGVEVLESRVAFDQPDASDGTLFPSDHFGLMARLRVG